MVAMQRLATYLTWLVMASAICAIFAMFVPKLVGYERYVLDGHSMEPTISFGSLVFDKPVRSQDVHVGDVITFVPPGGSGPVTHRVVEIRGEQRAVRTKGDNPAQKVDPWRMRLPKGRTPVYSFSVPYAGYPFMVMSHGPWRFLIVGLPALVVAFLYCRELWAEGGRLLEAERNRRPPATAEEAAWMSGAFIRDMHERGRV